MNTYEKKQETKRERFLELSIKASTQSDERYKSAKTISDQIVFGQPILIGHHSEKGHRRAISRINSNMSKSIELDEKANYYQKKAENMGKSGISSDDPEALTKLKEKLQKQEAEHTAMKNLNAKAKKEGTERPCPAYMLSNSNSRMKATKTRIDSLTKKESMELRETIKTELYTMREDKEENRIMFEFNGKPKDEIRNILKSHGFKWSPSRNAWVRMLNNAGRYSTKRVISKLSTSNNHGDI